jgi:hypothetical protein
MRRKRPAAEDIPPDQGSREGDPETKGAPLREEEALSDDPKSEDVKPSRNKPNGVKEGLFLHGYCGAFAVVLHREKGWPVGAFVVRRESDYPDERWHERIAHAVAIPEEGLVADVKGARKRKKVYKHIVWDESSAQEIGFKSSLGQQDLIGRMAIRDPELQRAKDAYKALEGRFTGLHQGDAV